jgi:hypothetical protein
MQKLVGNKLGLIILEGLPLKLIDCVIEPRWRWRESSSYHVQFLCKKKHKICTFCCCILVLHITYILVLVNTIFNGNWVYLFILLLFLVHASSSIHMSYVVLLYIQPRWPVGVHLKKKKKKKTILSRGTIPCAMTDAKCIQKFASEIPFSRDHLECNWLTKLQPTNLHMTHVW